MINSNRHTSPGIVDGKEGRAVGVMFDPEAEVMKLGNGSNVYLVSLPPLCVYVNIQNPKFENLPGLTIPVRQSMPVSVKVANIRIRSQRH